MNVKNGAMDGRWVFRVSLGSLRRIRVLPSFPQPPSSDRGITEQRKVHPGAMPAAVENAGATEAYVWDWLVGGCEGEERRGESGGEAGAAVKSAQARQVMRNEHVCRQW